jgi:CubicO group peptidase (beta-lactamase class C family)
MTRRKALRKGLATAVGMAATAYIRGGASALLAEGDIAPGEREAMAEVATSFMKKYNVSGLSVAIARAGHFVYQQPFGMADRQAGKRLTSSHLFRIASVTKPITSVAIFTLIEQGRLRLNDRIFGKSAVLGTDYGTPPYKQYVTDITLEHLLTHTCGGWQNDGSDPMFRFPKMDHAQLISWTLDHEALTHRPGEHWAYSNFGYCVLGRVIEKTTRQPYRDFVRESILARCGINCMRIAGNTLRERAPNEVIYYGQGGEDPYDMNVERMDSHGGWLATPSDLVRFLTHVDGFATISNILRKETIKVMTEPCSANSGYAKGWLVNSARNWWHNGSLPGSTTIMVRTSSGFCWAALTNTRSYSGNIGGDLDQMVWEMVHKIKSWQPA